MFKIIKLIVKIRLAIKCIVPFKHYYKKLKN